ncbi:MAG TPA: HAD family hydrolase [Gemmatimonadaceae bacterium]|nr:HAD family hydrolase [Gemmatimonadaceae bacterium]
MTRSAVFLDRDGTIIRDAHYVGSPDQVQLLPGAAPAIRHLNLAGIPVVVVTNQSGIARGFFTMDDFATVTDRLSALLRAEEAHVDATYVCPHHPDFTGPCDCRKPGTLLFRRAAEQMDLALAESWYIGDRLRDVVPARELGGTGILVPGPETSPEDIPSARPDIHVASSLDAAVTLVIDSARP